MADTLDELYTKSPGTQQVAATPNAESSNAAASNATASTYDASKQDVPTENLTSSRLNAITSQDSPLMQRARQEGMLLAARRGLQNSSIAAGTAQGAVVDRATPLATQEADILQGQRLANQNAENTSRQFNAGAQTDVSKLNAQLGTTVSQQNAQNATETSRFNAETAAQKAQQDAQAENAMRTAVMNQNAELNKQYLSGRQAQDLATIQAQYQALIQSNASAANLYNTYFQTIAQVMSNTNMDPARAAQIVGSLQTSLLGGMDFLNAMNQMSAQSGVPGGPNIRIPTTPTSGTFNSAGGEAAAGYLGNARQILADSFATQQQAVASMTPTGSTSSSSTPTSSAPSSSAPNAEVPAGAEASAYGGLLSTAGSVASAVGKEGGMLDSAGNVLSGLGGAANVVGGIQQGGVEGYGQAAAGAIEVGKSTGLIDSSLATDAAAYVNIATQLATGNYGGAGFAAADALMGGPYAAVGNLIASALNHAFLGNASKDRNVTAYANATGAKEVVLPMGHVGIVLQKVKNGDGTYSLISSRDFNDLAGSWYGAVVGPDGHQDEWAQKYKEYRANLKQASLPKGYTFDPNTGSITYRGKVVG